MRKLSSWMVVFSIFLGTGLIPSSLNAQVFPSKPIRIIVPSPAGSPPDVRARQLADKVVLTLGRPLIIENKPGAGGAIGMVAGAKSEPDGHTVILCASTALTVNPSMYDRPPYDPMKDFKAVMILYQPTLVLVANAALSANSLAELIQLAKAQPGKLFYGSAGSGTMPHIFTELFKATAEVDLVHVPYKGGAAATAALLTGEVSVTLDSSTLLMPHINAGKLRALAVTGKTRIAPLLQVPTFDETGVPGIDAGWIGIVAPAGTPDNIVMRLNREFGRALERPDIKLSYEASGLTIVASSPEEMTKTIAAEILKWREIVRKAGIKAD